MLTLFTIPKSFDGHFGIIQNNAIKSWTLLLPEPEIILFGDDHGTKEAAERFRIRHIPEVERNQYGSPLLNGIFTRAQAAANHEILCYVNADIILTGDLVRALKQAAHGKRPFLMIGIRHDLDIREPLNFSSGWEKELKEDVIKRGRPYPLKGVDYFVFPRGLWNGIPPFAPGHTIWDNWLIYQARSKRIPVIDTTEVVMAVHQDHQGSKSRYSGLERRRNFELCGGKPRIFRYSDATHILTSRGLRLALSREHLKRRIETMPVLFPASKPLIWILLRSLSTSKTFLRVIIRLLSGLKAVEAPSAGSIDAD